MRGTRKEMNEDDRKITEISSNLKEFSSGNNTIQ
jgi:hypothetical protein